MTIKKQFYDLFTLLVDFAASVCDFKFVRTIDFPRRASDRAFRVLSRWSPMKFKIFWIGLTLLLKEIPSTAPGHEFLFEAF